MLRRSLKLCGRGEVLDYISCTTYFAALHIRAINPSPPPNPGILFCWLVSCYYHSQGSSKIGRRPEYSGAALPPPTFLQLSSPSLHHATLRSIPPGLPSSFCTSAPYSVRSWFPLLPFTIPPCIPSSVPPSLSWPATWVLHFYQWPIFFDELLYPSLVYLSLPFLPYSNHLSLFPDLPSCLVCVTPTFPYSSLSTLPTLPCPFVFPSVVAANITDPFILSSSPARVSSAVLCISKQMWPSLPLSAQRVFNHP